MDITPEKLRRFALLETEMDDPMLVAVKVTEEEIIAEADTWSELEKKLDEAEYDPDNCFTLRNYKWTDKELEENKEFYQKIGNVGLEE